MRLLSDLKTGYFTTIAFAHRGADDDSRRGFTLLEIMIVVSIIGLFATLTISATMKARLLSQNAVFKNDLRRLSGDVFDLYALDNGDFPPDAAVATMPTGTVAYLPKRFDWTQKTSIGGRWDWDRAPDRSQKIHGGICYAGLTIVEPGRTSSQMSDIDLEVDDGDLSTGNLRSVGGGNYVLIIDP